MRVADLDIAKPRNTSPFTLVPELIASEWTKLHSVRSTLWSLLVAGVTALAGSLIVAISVTGTSRQPFDPVASIYLAWLEYPVLAVGILGVLTFSSEFATGQIRTTFTAAPQRRLVLAAKAAVVGALALVFGETLSFVAFMLSSAVRSKHDNALTLTHPGALRAVAAAGVVLCAIALLGVALGAIIRHTGGAIAALPALIYLPLAVSTLPTPWNSSIGRFTMLLASYQTVALHPRADLLSPAPSMLVVLSWPTIGLLVATVLIYRDT